VILDLVIIGLAIAFEPIPVTAFILVLLSDRGIGKGAAFIIGWLLSLTAVIAITLAATGNAPPRANTAPSTAALAVKIAIGVGLLGVAERQRRRLNRAPTAKKVPRWRRGIDHMSPWFALGLAALTQPWGIAAAGAAVVVQAKLSSWQSYLTLILFGLVATSSFLALEIYSAIHPARSRAILGRLRDWIDSHTGQIVLVLSVVLGLWLISYSSYLLLT
jgi:hypothetical protein